MKKSFTLIEMIISITLFSIIIIFLYETLDVSKKSNKFYFEKLNNYKTNSNIKKLFYEDILNSFENSIKIYEDRNKNTILSFQSNNTFHNAFYTNITYLISKDNELLRIQSKNKYDKKKLNKFKYEENKFIDIVQKDIQLFKVKYDKNNFILLLKNKKDNIYISIKL